MPVSSKINYQVLNRLSEDVDSVNQNNHRILYKILDDFIKDQTDFENLNDLFLKAGFVVNNVIDFANLPQVEIDTFVRERTKFSNFTELQNTAFEMLNLNKGA